MVARPVGDLPSYHGDAARSDAAPSLTAVARLVPVDSPLLGKRTDLLLEGPRVARLLIELPIGLGD